MDPANQNYQTTPNNPNTDMPEIVTAASTSGGNSNKYIFPLVIVILIIILSGIAFVVFRYIFASSDSSKQGANLSPTPYVGTSEMTLKSRKNDFSYAKVTRTRTATSTKHVISAFIEEPKEDAVYQAWIDSGSTEPISLGILEKEPDDKYYLEVNYEHNKPNTASFSELHNTYLISEEKINDDLLEIIILENTFSE